MMTASVHDKQQAMLQRFVEVYCREHHGRSDDLCDDCADLPAYAEAGLDACPPDPKPKCKACHIHCYTPRSTALR